MQYNYEQEMNREKAGFRPHPVIYTREIDGQPIIYSAHEASTGRMLFHTTQGHGRAYQGGWTVLESERAAVRDFP